MPWSEDSLHRWLARAPRQKALAGSAMHDASVLVRLRGKPVVCVDQTLEGRHFESDADPRAVGAKAVLRALSDLAASAARPRAIVLALCAPPTTDEAWIRAAIGGLRAAASRHGAELVGGDLASASAPRSLAVTALGEFLGARRPPGRDRARPGEVLLLTGPVGGSRLGRHLRPRPRLDEGRWLFERGAAALMDVSDGLAWDLHRLARTAGVRIVLERVPLHRDARRAARLDGRSALDHGLHDGEDHELLATLAPGKLSRVLREAPTRCPGLVVVGRVEAGRGLVLDAGLAGGRQRRWDPGEGGWRHGA